MAERASAAQPVAANTGIEDWMLVAVPGGRIPPLDVRLSRTPAGRRIGRVLASRCSAEPNTERPTGHVRIDDGNWTSTSLVVEMARTSARTLNTEYLLGRSMNAETDVSRLPSRILGLLASDAGVSGRA